MPSVLKALSALESEGEEDLSCSASQSPMSPLSPVDTNPHDFLGVDLVVSRRAINCLSIVLCGGFSREEQVAPLSLVVPLLRRRRPGEAGDRDVVHCSQLLAWINSHLCLNDVVYPSLSLAQHPHPSRTSTLTALTQDHPPEIASSGAGEASPLPVSPPVRVLEGLSTLSAARPTVLVDFHSSTYMLVATSGPIPRKVQL